MGFHKLETKDRIWAEPLLKASGFDGCDYSFANLCMWSDVYDQQIANVAGMVCVRSYDSENDEFFYLFPSGYGDLKEAVEFIRKDAKELGTPFVLRGFGQAGKKQLEELFPNELRIESIRIEWDYLYPVEDLAWLKGKKYHGKRNHIAAFEKDGDWSFEPISKHNIEVCQQLCTDWYRAQQEKGNEAALFDKTVVERALSNFDELRLEGGILYQNQKPVAFTVGEPLNENTYVVHIEKAFSEVRGAYPMINREFVRFAMMQYKYVNREEDDGVEGLMKAKMSYHPILLEKFEAREVDQV